MASSSWSSSALCIIMVMVATMSSLLVGAANLYKVGDAEGWRLPDKGNTDMYDTWASKYVFRVGDSIVFEYMNDSVVRVSKRGYYHCNETGPGSSTVKDGSTVFLLDKPGFYYFVSGDLDHCRKGQRLMIEAMDGRRPPDVAGPAPSPLPSSAVSWTTASVHNLVALGAFMVMASYCSCMQYLLMDIASVD